MLMGSSSRNAVVDAPPSPKYSDRLSPAINNYLSEASRQEIRVSLLCTALLFSTKMPSPIVCMLILDDVVIFSCKIILGQV